MAEPNEMKFPGGPMNTARHMEAAVCGRQSAKGVLRERIQQKEREIVQLRRLHDSLPELLDEQADAALWMLLMDARR